MSMDLFICYASDDMSYKDICLKRLAQLKNIRVEAWHDRLIEMGEDWEQAILTALDRCNT